MRAPPPDAVKALIARWVYGVGVPRLPAPPRVFLLSAPVAAIDAADCLKTTHDAPLKYEDEKDETPENISDDGVIPATTAERLAFFRRRAALAKATAARALETHTTSPASPEQGARGTSPAAPRAEAHPLAARPQPQPAAPPTLSPAPAPHRAHSELTLRRTIQAPDPWSIMPSRTLRGAGARHIQRRGDPLEAPETLEERVTREGPDVPRPGAPVCRWNLLIVPTQPAFRASDQGVKALALYLDRSQLLRSPTISTLEEFVGHPQHSAEDYWKRRLRGEEEDASAQIVTLTPGVFAHQIFYEGPAPSEGPPILQAHIGHRTKPKDVPFGPSDRQAAFWLALIGCRFDHVSRGFLERLHSILYLRPVLFAVPYTPTDALAKG